MLHKWLLQIFRRRVLIAILIVIQFAIFAVIINQSVAYSIVLETLFTFLSVAIALHVVWKKGKEAYKITWILQVLIFPVYGALFYLIFNRQTKTRKLQKKLEQIYKFHRSYLLEDRSVFEAASQEYDEYSTQMYYLQETMGFPVYDQTKITYYPIGEAYYQAMLADLVKAEKYIFFEFFIVAEGKMWSEIQEILIEKAAAGVKVNVMFDDIGSFVTLPNDTKEQLEAKGIECRVYNPFHPVLTSSQNNRDHRKVLSIDGMVAFTGGINIADEYINEIERFGHWKDTGIRLDGPGAWGQTLIFLELWQTMDETLSSEKMTSFLPEFNQTSASSSRGYVQPFADSPTDTQNVGEQVFVKMIHQAKKSVLICTPYLILDENLETALVLAAQSGVDVKIILPKIWDKYLVHMTSRSYYKDLIEAGVDVYEYTRGFMHAKSLIVDDEAAVIGTINFDYRSLYLHFENAVALYGVPEIKDMIQDYKETLKQSEKIKIEDLPQSVIVLFAKRVLRLFAPLM
ncbi:cardiolipin synthase [Marinilactibacillus piezotolerans]|uniref:cardiolipin synthase n=1 Tax=Marinilactibacillus piezotolerans TaxID=258723 RepID=UPI0015C45B9E|nr:cardiolipin synthase [Marinilactibacillus piezotolerans]